MTKSEITCYRILLEVETSSVNGVCKNTTYIATLVFHGIFSIIDHILIDVLWSFKFERDKSFFLFFKQSQESSAIHAGEIDGIKRLVVFNDLIQAMQKTDEPYTEDD